MRPCFHNGPSKGVNKRKVSIEETKIFEVVKLPLWTEKTEIARKRGFAVSIVHIYVIFLSLYLFEEILFDLVFKYVDIVGRFQV